MFKKQWRYVQVTLKRVFSQKKNTPQAIAKGAMAGVFLGMTPSVGFQILPAILIATALKGNRMVAVVMTFVSNPFTVMPIYAMDFFIGKILLPEFTNISFAKVEDLILDFSFSKFFNIGYETILVLWAGGIVVAIPSGILTYYIFLYLVSMFRKKQEERKEAKRLLRATVRLDKTVDGGEETLLTSASKTNEVVNSKK